MKKESSRKRRRSSSTPAKTRECKRDNSVEVCGTSQNGQMEDTLQVLRAQRQRAVQQQQQAAQQQQQAAQQQQQAVQQIAKCDQQIMALTSKATTPLQNTPGVSSSLPTGERLSQRLLRRRRGAAVLDVSNHPFHKLAQSLLQMFPPIKEVTIHIRYFKGEMVLNSYSPNIAVQASERCAIIRWKEHRRLGHCFELSFSWQGSFIERISPIDAETPHWIHMPRQVLSRYEQAHLRSDIGGAMVGGVGSRLRLVAERDWWRLQSGEEIEVAVDDRYTTWKLNVDSKFLETSVAAPLMILSSDCRSAAS